MLVVQLLLKKLLPPFQNISLFYRKLNYLSKKAYIFWKEVVHPNKLIPEDELNYLSKKAYIHYK
jgi:hypothetical protein